MVAGLGDMAGRVCVVTGATSGIGRETVLGLARMGATVVAAGRSPERSEALVREVKQRTGSERVEVVLGDLASQTHVRRIAREIEERHPVVHVLVNNAGIIASKREVTEDGVEKTIAVNHLAPFLLTSLLMDALKRGATVERRARVVTVSSDAHRAGRLDFEDLDYQKWGRRMTSLIWGMRAYCDSKLANVLFTYELARRLQGEPIDSFAVHPGSARTGIWGSAAGAFGRVMWLVRPFLMSAERGARPVLQAAVAAELEGKGGTYVTQKGIARSSAASYDETAARRLWEVSERLTGMNSAP
jgi:NAD(P)-dependent dehydrogenase (short-subunit alcohol dehydrogenase family)